jgi:hypothetical protein
VEFVEDREEWALGNIAYSTTTSGSGMTLASSGGHRGYERKDAKVMAVKVSGKGDVHFPHPRSWTPDHPWGRPCLVEECKEKHTPTACTLFNNKCPEERLAIVRKRELCTLCFRHLDTNRCWSLGKVASRGIRGGMMAHCLLFHDVLQDEKVMMVSASQRIGGGAESALRCWQVVAMENGGQCFRIIVLYDWGATASMVTREAANTLGLTSS